MTLSAGDIREFRLMLRRYFDAQFDDWGEEADAPRFAELDRLHEALR